MGKSHDAFSDEQRETFDQMSQVVADSGGDPERPRTRRQLLMLGGAVAGGAALTIAGASPAFGANNDPVLAGSNTDATLQTTVTNSTNSLSALGGISSGTDGIGLRGNGTGAGADVKLDGTGRLSQSAAGGATGGAQPSANTLLFDFSRGDAHEVWASAGTNAWKRINAVRTDNPSGNGSAFAPFRFVDTRSGSALSTNTTTPYDITGNANIPDNAVAIFGNVTCIPDYQGFLTMFPKGVAVPVVANVNFNPFTIAGNFFFVGLGTGANAGQLSVRPGDAPSKSTHVIIDIFAYVQ